MAFIALKHEAARGLSAINAMHPECPCYNYFISRGHSALDKTVKAEIMVASLEYLVLY